MDIDLIQRKFARMGARVLVAPLVRSRRSPPASDVAVDIRRDDKGEYFDIRFDPRWVEDVDALDVQPAQRHLLLMAKVLDHTPEVVPRWNWRREATPVTPAKATGKVEKAKFLCGHDERSWFVAAVPENAAASTVRTAMEALKPPAVRDAQAMAKVHFAKRNRRKNRGFVRQGEWFFIPRPAMVVDKAHVLRNEPLRRNDGGKPHWAEWAYRTGGETVWVSEKFPAGLGKDAYAEYLRAHPNQRLHWTVMVRNAGVYVKGRIRHPDHATIRLDCWHEVFMNTESQAKARRNVVFLD